VSCKLKCEVPANAVRTLAWRPCFGLHASGDSFELCGGLHLAPNGHDPAEQWRCVDRISGAAGLCPGHEEASARIKDSSVEAPGSPSWGDWRASKSLMPAGHSGVSLPDRRRTGVGWAAPGPSDLPAGNGLIQELDPGGVEFAAAVFVPLAVDPHPEGVFPFRGVVVVAGPLVAFGAEVRELGETVMPPGLVRCCPGVPGPPGDRREAVPVGRGTSCRRLSCRGDFGQWALLK
jgi:hypothetical protein